MFINTPFARFHVNGFVSCYINFKNTGSVYKHLKYNKDCSLGTQYQHNYYRDEKYS